MHAHVPALVSLSAGLFAALTGGRSRSTPVPPTTDDTTLTWTGGPPDDDDARIVWQAVTARPRARHADVVAEAAEHLFRRDLARLGSSADIGFFQPFYRAYAQDLVRRLVGTHLSLEDAR